LILTLGAAPAFGQQSSNNNGSASILSTITTLVGVTVVGGGTDGGSRLEESSSDVEDDTSSYERFFGTVDLDPLEAEPEFARIVDEVLQHLTAVRDADVTVSVDIEVDFDGDGLDEDTVRTVSENTDALDFRHGAFEEE